ncbi:MAG: CBS domain-containing protein [Actinomycetota bacterium]
MVVRDVMSTRLLCVRPDAPLKEVAAILVRNRIGGVPVVGDDGRVVGILSESDLQPAMEGAPARPLRTAADVMTRPIVTLTEADTVTQAARVLLRHRIKRAPVLREGVIVGMVTRGDLLRPYLRTDLEIRADVEEALFGEPLDIRGDQVRVRVSYGVVRLEGRARDSHERALAEQLARAVDGIIDVDNGLEVA